MNPAATEGNVAASYEPLLRGIYTLLREGVSPPGLDERYRRLLLRILGAAWRAEQPGHAFCLLPLLACQAAGGELELATPVGAAWRALHIAAGLLDDVEDGEVALGRREPAGPSRVTNAATGLMAAASLCLAQLARMDAALYITLQQDFSRTVLRMAGGQHRDLARSLRGAGDALHAIEARSGTFFSLAARSGARCATRDEGAISTLAEFGHSAGMLVQLMDDLTDLHKPWQEGDLALGRRSLPVAYALGAYPDGDRKQLGAWLARAAAGDAGAAERARALIVAAGADLYVAAEMARYRHRAAEALRLAGEAGLHPQALERWLAQI